jgi:hypothetical protein
LRLESPHGTQNSGNHKQQSRAKPGATPAMKVEDWTGGA